MKTRRPKPLESRYKRLLVVLFIPSVERDGATPIDHDQWVDEALEMFGRIFGGATHVFRVTQYLAITDFSEE